ncbi:MAG: hypothetical protein ACOC8X_10150 [Chloroflexota bacterium]
MPEPHICQTCGKEHYQRHCHNCQPAEWYRDLAAWHRQQAVEMDKMAEEAEEQQGVGHG